MENKKTKLTISGKSKKSIRNFDPTKSHGVKSISVSRNINKFIKKETSSRSNKPI